MYRPLLCVAVALSATPLLAADGATCPASSSHASKPMVKATFAAHHNEAKPNLVETAVAAGKFNTLVAAVKAAGLVDALSGKDNLTVFAPTDEAFAKIPQATLESLLEPGNKEKLTKILTYHVVSGSVMAKDVVGLREAKTLEGSKVAIGVSGDRVYVDNAKVIATDVKASNGVIHVIDTVLMPAE